MTMPYYGIRRMLFYPHILKSLSIYYSNIRTLDYEVISKKLIELLTDVCSLSVAKKTHTVYYDLKNTVGYRLAFNASGTFRLIFYIYI